MVRRIIGLWINIQQYKTERYFTLHIPIISTYDTHFHEVVFILLALLNIRSQEKGRFFQCTYSFSLFLFLSYKSLYTIS